MSYSTVDGFLSLGAGAETVLEADVQFPTAGHLWSQPEIDALILACAACRPLLVRGEAGSGKSQIARAAAVRLSAAPLLVEVIHPRFEALDLLYRVDSIERLADAQVHNLDPLGGKYVKRGALWQAMERAQEVATVLLIDEIDKADADVPNALLAVLGNRSFHVSITGETVHAGAGRFPVVVLTTNEERELPAAFVRRCVVLNLNPPAGEEKFVAWLVARGRVHRHLEIADEVRDGCARQVWADRQAAIRAGCPKVGLAEYVDLLTALDSLTKKARPTERARQQRDWLAKLSAYALVKNADQDQSRAARSDWPTATP